MRGFNQERGVAQKITSGHRGPGLDGLMVKAMSWFLRVSLRSREPLGGHPAWKAGHPAEQMTLRCPSFTQVAENAAAFLKSCK